MTAYLVYRHGSNASNQSMRDVAPVAIVEAPSREAACETDGDEHPTVHSSLWLRLAPDVDCWANQRFSAVPLSRAPRADVREVQEQEAIRGAYVRE